MAQHSDHITVYYDASCPKCVKDRVNYKRMAGEAGNDVCWVDITGRDDELRELGIDPHMALTELHLRDKQGRILSEIDAYILLMQRVPRLRILAWLIGLPVIRPLVAWLYHRMVIHRLRKENRL
jgi:predicted DCC family thiol-disulfide oxidoreductase YuxK